MASRFLAFLHLLFFLSFPQGICCSHLARTGTPRLQPWVS
jgi:hypothetical protein